MGGTARPARCLNAKAPAQVTLSGFVWSDPIKKVVAVSNPFSVQTAGFVFGADAHHDLSPAEQMMIARMGRAVSPVTSYVAWEPGARPSIEGLEWGPFGYGRGSGAGYGAGRRNIIRQAPDFAKLIDVSACVKSVKPAAAWSVTLAVETTKDEVVHVDPTTKDAMATCLAETTWGLTLDPGIFHLTREDFVVELSGAAAP